MDLYKLAVLAKKVRFGFEKCRLTADAMNFSAAEVQLIRRQKNKKGFKNCDDAFFIASLCFDILKKSNQRKTIIDKIKSQNPKNIKEAFTLLDIDIDNFLQVIEEDYDNPGEDIVYCAAVFSISKLSASKTLNLDFLYEVINLVDKDK